MDLQESEARIPTGNFERSGSLVAISVRLLFCNLLIFCWITRTDAAQRDINLAAGYSNLGEVPFQRVYTARLVNGDRVESGYGRDLHEIERLKGGASNAFLVEATDIKDAMSATRSVLAGYRSADRPATALSTKASRGNHWLVTYLGCAHSSPAKWVVEGVSVDNGRVQLTYREPKARTKSADARRYYYWIPLGKLEPGVYNVGLYDSGLGAVTFMRRIDIEPEK